MKINRIFLACLLWMACSIAPAAARQLININNNWHFRFSHQVQKNSGQRVDLPHTWNASDALSGKMDYKRGIGNYTKTIMVPEAWKGRRLFIRFQGANSVADVFVNGRHVGEHRGGYEAFIYELTDKVEYGKENTLLVRVNNGEQLDVMPLVGDFTFYGGLYRDVELLLTDEVCISPTDYASPGVRLMQQHVTDDQAQIRAAVMLSNGTRAQQSVEVTVSIADGDRVVARQTVKRKLTAGAENVQADIPLTVEHPHLWNGVADPFLYTVTIALRKDGRQVDEVVQPLGLRYYCVDPVKGFFLNGHHLTLHGVSRHQDWAIVGNALRAMHHEKDVRLMREMGVNVVRLSHYPQSDYMLTLLDRAGIIAWSEIPFVGPGGYADKGYVDSERFRENGFQQLREMIRQLYNHPSICFWGLFNELKYDGDNPVSYIRQLHAEAHREDPYRLTTCASNQDGEMNLITDIGAWNRYDGWYGSKPATLATYLDAMHAQHPERCIGVSEYGAGASIYHQQDSLLQPDPAGWWHPENWQTWYHIRNWEILSARPFLWGTFIWNMFDFGAAHRTEGDRPGINDKGMVTHDRTVKKDAFYFYKANWNPEPMVWIAGKRAVNHHHSGCELLVFTNCPSVRLLLNGQEVGTASPDRVHVCTFRITLHHGENTLQAETRDASGHVLTDTARLLME